MLIYHMGGTDILCEYITWVVLIYHRVVLIYHMGGNNISHGVVLIYHMGGTNISH